MNEDIIINPSIGDDINLSTRDKHSQVAICRYTPDPRPNNTPSDISEKSIIKTKIPPTTPAKPVRKLRENAFNGLRPAHLVRRK